MNDGLYPLTDVSFDHDSEHALDHPTSDALQRPDRAHYLLEHGNRAIAIDQD